jgi:hypothetical protein
VSGHHLKGKGRAQAPKNRTATILHTDDEQLETLFADCSDDEEPVVFDHQAFALSFAQRLKQATGKGRIRNMQPDIWIVENELGGWILMYPRDY